MTYALDDTEERHDSAPDQTPPEPPKEEPAAPEQPPFILYQGGDEFAQTLGRLAYWVHNLLIPVYGREVTSGAPWCPEWWQHPEAVAQLHGLSLAWQEMTGPKSSLSGPAAWHRDFLLPAMSSLRDPSGPFSGCRPGAHRAKQVPPIAPFNT